MFDPLSQSLRRIQLRQTILLLCLTNCVELSAYSDVQSFSPSQATFKSRLNTHLFNIAFNDQPVALRSAYRPPRLRICDTGIWRVTNWIIIIIIIISCFPWFSSSTCSRRTFGVCGTGFFCGLDILSSSQQCQSTEETSTDPNQWPGLIHSSSGTGRLMEGALLPLGQISQCQYPFRSSAISVNAVTY